LIGGPLAHDRKSGSRSGQDRRPDRRL